jgi:hypothetical protein
VHRDFFRISATYSSWFLVRGFFCPEDGGDTFLRNVGAYKTYTVPHPRRRHSFFFLFPNIFLAYINFIYRLHTLEHSFAVISWSCACVTCVTVACTMWIPFLGEGCGLFLWYWGRNGSIVPALLIYEKMVHWWNNSQHRRQMYSERNGLSYTLSTTNPISSALRLNPGFHGEKPVTNCLSYGTTM